MTRAEQIRQAQAKYKRSAKGRATQARYRHTNKGRLIDKESNARRIFIGHAYHSRATTPELASAIKAHVGEKRREFITRQQARAQTEGA